MLNKDKSERIWKNLNIIETGIVKNKKTVANRWIPIECKIPYIEDLSKSAISKLKELGFFVERVEPQKANCIIRVFRDDNLKYEGDTHWMYGVEVYIKTSNIFYSKFNVKIDYATFKVRKWFFQDESTIMEPNFVDYYLRVK